MVIPVIAPADELLSLAGGLAFALTLALTEGDDVDVALTEGDGVIDGDILVEGDGVREGTIDGVGDILTVGDGVGDTLALAVTVGDGVGGHVNHKSIKHRKQLSAPPLIPIDPELVKITPLILKVTYLSTSYLTGHSNHVS
jgi:hypothetical protein